MKIQYGEQISSRKFISDYVLSKKENNKFTVIDVGGSAFTWTLPFTDAYIDINKCNTDKLQFNFDICKEKDWEIVLDYVSKYGKFDFSICTHTLEDIFNPYLVLEYLPKISNSGIITTPSIQLELSHIESDNWLGFIHHRYLFGTDGTRIIIAPKLPVVEKISLNLFSKEVFEIQFYWEKELPYEIFLDGYLGPTASSLLQNYEEFLKQQLHYESTFE